MEKEFKCGAIAIRRGDYEGLPLPMCASELPDETMQEIADDIYWELRQCYSDEEVERYFEKSDGSRECDHFDEAFWREMEQCAINHGMKYYEED